MKSLIALVTLLITTSAAAETCSANLVTKNGRILDSFTETNYYSRDFACDEALRSCRYEKQRNDYNRQYRQASCEIEVRNSKKSCTYEMISKRGRIVDVFTEKRDRFNSACQNAKEACEQAKYRTGKRGATCVKTRGSQRDIVTRTCSVERVGNTRNGRTRTIQVHTGTARGERGTGIKQRACSEAMQACRSASRSRHRNGGGRCISRNF